MAGQAVTVQPLTTESSVEAAVLLQMVGGGTALADVDLVGLRANVDAGTASVVQAHAADQASEATADIQALAVAALAAQASQAASLKAASIDATAYAAAELEAADTLTAAVNADATATTQANAAFTASLAGLDTKLGMSAAAAAAAATNASASAQQAIAAGSSSADLKAAFDLTQATIESLATTTALGRSFTPANASASVMALLETGDTDLVASVGTAADAAAVTTAFATWRAAVQGPGGLIEAVLGGAITATPAPR